MVFAATISEKIYGISCVAVIQNILLKYQLPIGCNINADEVITILASDKKRNNKGINYILLKKIGKATIQPITINKLKKELSTFGKPL